jgi:hypothetical protein
MRTYIVHFVVYFAAVLSIVNVVASDDKQERLRLENKISSPVVTDEDREKHEKILESIVSVIKDKDYGALHLILKNIQQKRTEPAWYYVIRVWDYVGMINVDVIKKDVVLRRDIVRLCDNAISKHFEDNEHCTILKDQLSMMMCLFCCDIEYDRRTDLINKPLSQSLRKKRVKQLLKVWKNLNDVLDKGWIPDGDCPRDQLSVYTGGYQALVFISIENATRHIKDDKEKKIQAEKIMPIVRAELDDKIETLTNRVNYYSRQERLHDIVSRYEPNVILFLSVLYSTKPYNTDELKGLINEYGMSDELSQKILSEVERRIANQEKAANKGEQK